MAFSGGLRLLSFAAALAIALPGEAAEPLRTLELRVEAGRHDRKDTPIRWELPEALRQARGFRLYEVSGDDAAEVPVQRLEKKPPELVWILRGTLPAGGSRAYRLEAYRDPVPVRPGGGGLRVECTDDGRFLTFRAGGKPVLRYNHAVIAPPPGYDPVFARSGYIHPVWTPAGDVITNDFPPNHKHHHGIWFPWTNTEFEGRKVDFWNSAARKGKVEFTGFEGFGGGPVCGWFRARHRHIDLTAPGGPKAALNEVWEVTVYALTDHFLFDLVSIQTCAGSSPLLLKQYRYGGLGFRGSHEWEGDRVYFLTSEGKTRKDGHATSARWCDIYGELGGRKAGITVLCHPANFRFPQRMRIHPTEPFFNFAPCQSGDFAIEPGKPYVSRYRFYVHEGFADPKASDRVWYDYGEPPDVKVVRD